MYGHALHPIASSLPQLCEPALLPPFTDGRPRLEKGLAQGHPASGVGVGSGLESGGPRDPRPADSGAFDLLPHFDPSGLLASSSTVIGKGRTDTGSGGPTLGRECWGAPTTLGAPVPPGPREKSSRERHPCTLRLCKAVEIGWLCVLSAVPSK